MSRPQKRLKNDGDVTENPTRPIRSRGKRGSLSGMLQIPMEVFCEISGNLSPMDLLHMSRCSRDLRAVLLSKSSTPMWEAARSNLNVPACPIGWSEPAYAQLLFENICSGCGTRSPSIYYVLRVRCCKSCAETHLGNAYDIINREYPDRLEGEIPLAHHYPIYQLVPTEIVKCVGTYRRRRQVVRKDSLLEAVRKYLDLDDQGRLDFLEKKKEELNEIVKHGNLLRDWARAIAEENASKKSDICKQREEFVKSKLLLKGYPDSRLALFSEASKEWDKLVRTGRPLTERAWKNLMPKLEELAGKCTARIEKWECEDQLVHRRRECEKFYEEYMASMSEDKRIKPSINDVMLAPFADTLLRRDNGKITVTRAQWVDYFVVPMEEFVSTHDARIRALLQNMIDTARNKLDELIHKQLLIAEVEDVVYQLSLEGPATFLRDGFLVETIASFLDKCSQRELDPSTFGMRYSLTETSLNDYRVDIDLACIAGALLRSLRKVDVSMECMVSLGSVFVCQRCSLDNRVSRSWPDLVNHFSARIKFLLMANEEGALMSDHALLPMPASDIVKMDASYGLGNSSATNPPAGAS